ncbi:Uncharacterised protein [Vibrio cholerae]|nr:Uncharacterised protein [Vibrio cholerae]
MLKSYMALECRLPATSLPLYAMQPDSCSEYL